MGSFTVSTTKCQSWLNPRSEQLRSRRPRQCFRKFECRNGFSDTISTSQSLPPHSLDSLRFRSVFISDIHLGTPQSHAEAVLSFLEKVETEYLYLVGDIVDGWKLKANWYWPDSHNDVVQKVLQLARCGTNIIYIPGNHDEGLRSYLRDEALWFGNVAIVEEMIHRTADGRTFLVLHGDRCDEQYCLRNAFKRAVGDWVYDRFVDANITIKAVRQRLGMPYWSLAAHVKDNSKFAQKIVDDYEAALAGEAERQGVDGVICGHIHKPGIRRIGSVLYCNDGDWVDSCTALVEDFDGSLRLLNWWDYLAGAEGQGSQKAGTDDESLIKQQGLLLNISSRLAGRNQQPR